MDGRALRGVFGDGKGKEAELDWASGACNARWDGRFALGSSAALLFDCDDSGLDSKDVARGVLAEVSDDRGFALGSLAILIESLGFLCRPELPATVWLRANLCVWLASDMVPSLSCGFLA